MSEPTLSMTADDDLPRTIRRERDAKAAREREARERDARDGQARDVQAQAPALVEVHEHERERQPGPQRAQRVTTPAQPPRK